MFTYETADQKEVRRFRIAQFNGRAATVRNGKQTVTGHVRSVLAKAASVPPCWTITIVPAADPSPPARPRCVPRRGFSACLCGRWGAFSGATDAALCCEWLQRRADEVRGVARAELAHHLGTMALEGSRADLHLACAPCLLVWPSPIRVSTSRSRWVRLLAGIRAAAFARTTAYVPLDARRPLPAVRRGAYSPSALPRPARPSRKRARSAAARSPRSSCR